jgi:hypothetical protein
VRPDQRSVKRQHPGAERLIIEGPGLGRREEEAPGAAATIVAPTARARTARALRMFLRSDDLDDPAAVALAVELEEEHALPGAEAELAVAHGDRLARRA